MMAGLGSLAGYVMSDSDNEGETDDMHKLSGNISGSDDEGSTHSKAPSRTYSPVVVNDPGEPPIKKKPAPGKYLYSKLLNVSGSKVITFVSILYSLVDF